MSYINPDHPVYISYAWSNDDHPHLEDDVNALCNLLEKNHIYYKRDKENLCPYRCDISKAEKEIGEGSAIIVVISERYIKSPHCMHEWHQMRENGKIWERVFPIVLEDAKLTDDSVFEEYHDYYVKKRKDLAAKLEKGIVPFKSVEGSAAEYDFFQDDLRYMYRYLANHNYYFSKDNYITIIEQLKVHLQGLINKINNPIEPVKLFGGRVAPDVVAPAITPVVAPVVAHFSLPAPDGLVRREKEEDKLFKLLSKNRVVNLVGVGGSGKSSLAYLTLDAHKDSFNEMVYVVVNNNIKDDIVELFNHQLKLAFREGEDPFLKIISYLQENYQSGKPNLLVLDINETSDKHANATIVNGIIQNLDGWKVLILSRENIDTRHRINGIKIHSLNDNHDRDFLGTLFLEKAGTRYAGAIDLDELFEVIYYNPLLVEQLGYFLKYYPKRLSVEEIKTKLYGDSFRGQLMKGQSAQSHDETIVSFLKKLIKFNELNLVEKELLRHFVLWQSDYISFDVIEDLLKGVFDSDDQLINALTTLTERSIIIINSGQTLSYRLHGLLADSLREQIEMSQGDYSKYLDNIERIIEYDYYHFLPYVDCIGNSLCEYNITTDDMLSYYDFVNRVGEKLNESWKYDYCQKVLDKNIRRIEDKRKQDDNPFLLDILLDALRTNTYGLSAISNHKKAIAILEQQPKENVEYQHRLANAYTVLAILQVAHLGAYKSAETNYQKAIEIYEQLPRENNLYQGNLAIAYNNLAVLQQDQLEAYDLAETNYKQAIDILEKLPKENHESQDSLAIAYNNLANLQRDHLEAYDLAAANYQQAIDILEKLPKENHESQNRLAVAHTGLANLQKNHLGAYDLSAANYQQAIEILERLPKENHDYQDSLANAYNGLAYCYDAQKRYDDAVVMVNQAIDIAKGLSEKVSTYLIYWINYRHSLAEIVFNNKQIEKAKEILDEIKPLAEKCLAEKPNDRWTQTVNNYINELLGKCAKA